MTHRGMCVAICGMCHDSQRNVHKNVRINTSFPQSDMTHRGMFVTYRGMCIGIFMTHRGMCIGMGGMRIRMCVSTHNVT